MMLEMCEAEGENEYQQNQDTAAWSLFFLKIIQKTTFEGIVCKLTEVCYLLNNGGGC